MSHALRASFYVRLRAKQEADADNCGGDTSTLLREAEGLATTWADKARLDDDADGKWTMQLSAALETFWFLVVLIARHSDANGPHQDSLVALIESKRDVGRLNEESHEKVRAAWREMPSFDSELFDAMLRAPPIGPAEQYTNLHAFAARVTAAGIRDLTFYAVWAFYDALEVDGPYYYPRSEKIAKPGPERFGPCIVWLRHCGPQIWQACQLGRSPPRRGRQGYLHDWHNDPPAYVGKLALEAGVKTEGFSHDRWLHWTSRLRLLLDTCAEESHACSELLEVMLALEA